MSIEITNYKQTDVSTKWRRFKSRLKLAYRIFTKKYVIYIDVEPLEGSWDAYQLYSKVAGLNHKGVSDILNNYSATTDARLKHENGVDDLVSKILQNGNT
ncbi:MAG: hypothetical protein PSN34_06450 [Urechidicola sp.]|nr:hypothetical protein [Urechidicola sp.]